jgi:hypothetical protein
MTAIKVFIKPGTRCSLEDTALSSEYGVELVSDPVEAHWIIAPRVKSLIPYCLKFPGKKFLVYTNEPRHSRLIAKQFRPAPLLPKIEVMNVFTGDVFWHNFHFLGSYHFDTQGSLDIDLQRSLPPLSASDLGTSDKRPVAAFFTYRLDNDTSYVIEGVDCDLELARCSYARALHEAGLCDIYGGNWPPGVSREDSGYTSSPEAAIPWWTRKMSLLAGYRYNLCLENTSANYYCTEKIWHAIQAGTLPIYWGANNTIFEVFPRNSFIDLADFHSPEGLIEYLHMLTGDEYLERINKCREVFNGCIIERRKTIGEESRQHMDRLKRLAQ